jgi:hypothetical protein
MKDTNKAGQSWSESFGSRYEMGNRTIALSFPETMPDIAKASRFINERRMVMSIPASDQ